MTRYNPQTDAMNPRQLYKQLIWWAQENPAPETDYREQHHIIPRHVFRRHNRRWLERVHVTLTPWHHFLAHMLYARWHNTRGNWAAVWQMATDQRNRRRQDLASTLTPETFNNIRAQAMATRSTCPAFRKAHLAGIARRTADPEWQRKNAESTRRTAANPGWQERHRTMVARVTSTPEWQANHAAAMTRLAQDPKWQKKHARVLELIHTDPEIIQRQADGIRRYMAIPGVREAIAERNRRIIDSDEWREAHAEGMARRHADPEWWRKNREAVQRTTATPEWKEAHALARRARMNPVIGRPIAGGSELYFIGASRAEPEGFTQEGITDCCNGKRHTHAGYVWRFAQPGEAALMMPPIPDYRPALKVASERRIKPVIGTPVAGGLPILLRGAAAIDAAGFQQGCVVAAVRTGKAHLGYTWHYGTSEEIDQGVFGEPVPVRTPSVVVIGTPLAGGNEIRLVGAAGIRAAGFEPPNVTACCKGRIKSHKGYRWRYA